MTIVKFSNTISVIIILVTGSQIYQLSITHSVNTLEKKSLLLFCCQAINFEKITLHLIFSMVSW